jgi:putative DNA primase/helicase
VNFGTIGAPPIDKELPKKLLEELPGILNWALTGCAKWQQQGLSIPPQISAWTEEYRDSNDTLAPFFEEILIMVQDLTISQKELFLVYDEWERQNGNGHPLGKKQFNQALRRPGIVVKKPSNGNRVWKGISYSDQGRELLNTISVGFSYR